MLNIYEQTQYFLISNTIFADIVYYILVHGILLHSKQGSSRQGIGPSQKPLPDNIQHSQEVYIHALGETQKVAVLPTYQTKWHRNLYDLNVSEHGVRNLICNEIHKPASCYDMTVFSVQEIE
jgi:hypothetical protein